MWTIYEGSKSSCHNFVVVFVVHCTGPTTNAWPIMNSMMKSCANTLSPLLNVNHPIVSLSVLYTLPIYIWLNAVVSQCLYSNDSYFALKCSRSVICQHASFKYRTESLLLHYLYRKEYSVYKFSTISFMHPLGML
jgi:hypothetical protein